ncbi:MAG: glycine zipper family protein [Maritimibacter sp.]|nr:glycine zipper family protein [Maritimibacter sp.]
MKHTLLLPLAAVALLSACDDTGANYRPILDGAPTAAYERDLAACQTLARDQRQFDQEAVAAAVLGAGVGAVLGSFSDEADAAGGAIAGGLAGGASVAVDNSDRREAIVVECLRGRGHRVVG